MNRNDLLAMFYPWREPRTAEPPLSPGELPCGCGQCDGDCEENPDDQYDRWVDMQIEDRENK